MVVLSVIIMIHKHVDQFGVNIFGIETGSEK